ncbi:MAG TPA: neutral zinc metallopeptidase [Candidatus Saccharimonadales bacterium]|nr:neutral zinc metallopeptidase [Candidatus Saccharimonadales bacterium]
MKRLIGAAIMACLLASSCGVPKEDDYGIPSSPAPATSAASRPTDIPSSAYARLKPISPKSDCEVSGDLEGRFTKSQMAQYLECIVPDVDRWIDVTYQEMPHPKGYFFVPSGISAVLGDCPVNDKVLQYCGNVDQIFLGQAAVWQQYSVYGDAAPPVVVAHELGHHFQHEVGMKMAAGNAQIRYENQADCVAGAYMSWARSRGLMSRDDVKDLSGSLIAAADADGPRRDHGTKSERIGAFELSYDNVKNVRPTLRNCNQYVPEIPIVQ